jgi:hypothetical protein
MALAQRKRPNLNTADGRGFCVVRGKPMGPALKSSHPMREELTQIVWLASMIAMVSIAGVGLAVGLAVTIGLWPS